MYKIKNIINNSVNKFITLLPLALALLFIFSAVPIYARDALFLGLTDGRGQPVHPNMELAIRHDLSTNRALRLIGEVETQRFLREKDRLNHGRTEPIIPPNIRLADSVIIIRGVVRELSLTPGRRALLWGRINARMTVEFYFNEVSGPAAYHGQFSAKASKGKGILLFANPQKTIHIAAPERVELTDQLQAQIIKEFSEFTTLFFNSLATGPIHRREELPEMSEEMVEED